jgi:Protein of unknown function (DUF2961)
VVDQVSTIALGTSGTGVTVQNVPSPQAGELLLVWVTSSFGGDDITWTPTPGFAQVECESNTTKMSCLFVKTAGSSEPSTYAWAASGGPGDIHAGVFEVAGASATIGAVGAQAQASGYPTAPSVTTASANNLVVACYGAEGNTSAFTVPSGYNLVMDPGTISGGLVQLTSSNAQEGGVHSRILWSTGNLDGGPPMLCAAKAQASAGASGGAAVHPGYIMMAYAGSPGEVDHYNVILAGGSGQVGITNNVVTVWRDGESTPSVQAQVQDLSGRRGITTGERLHSRYLGFLANGLGQSAEFAISMPFTQSMVMQVDNPDNVDTESLYTNVDFHANSLAAPAWGNYAHFTTVQNSSYPSADSVTHYTEDTLCNVTGAGSLWSVYLQINGGDNNTMSYAEGTINIYLNGESTPSSASSGTEDFFCDSFDWQYDPIPFATDLCAGTYLVDPGSGNPGSFGAIRFFPNKDPISFTSGVKVTWTAGNSTTGPSMTNPASVISSCGIYFTQ